MILNMIPLYTEEQFNNARSTEKLPLKCEQCGKTFYEQKKMIKFILNHPDDKVHHCARKFCSKKCLYSSQEKKICTVCANCGKEIKLSLAEFNKSKSGNHFCSKSCAVSYNNKHKEFGTRRSKLEKYIEEKLSLLYPDIKILFNDKTSINSELDIYIPSLKLAFELNGIFHYEPIFGDKKLLNIQENDKNKFKLCQEKNISLCVIDTSSLKYFKEQNAEKYLNIIISIINENINSVTN